MKRILPLLLLALLLPVLAQAQGPDLTGTWSTSEGEMQISHAAKYLFASYNPGEHGRIVGEIVGNRFIGYWIEDVAGERCSSTMDGRYFWGMLTLEFTDRGFTGKWGYCDKAPHAPWSGQKR